MKKKFSASLFLFGTAALLGLSSCGCSGIFNQRITFTINDNIENGKVQVINYFRDTEDTLAGDVIKVEAIGKDGYKVKQLLINGQDITLTPRIKIGKEDHYDIDATFEPYEAVDVTGSFDDNKTTYETINSTHKIGTIPNQGDTNILVVPVEFSDVEAFSEGEIQNINNCFNGNKADGSNQYWESVSSFYRKSSYGKLNMTFDVTDVYTPKFTSQDFIQLERNDDAEGNYKILSDLYNTLTIDGKPVDYKNYDANKDGFVDGVWLIHNYKDKRGVFTDNNFWAYCHVYSTLFNQPSLEKPRFSRYANCSQAFMYQGRSGTNQYGNDAHTLIHETGHMLGLDDYYSYDTVKDGKQEVQILGAAGGIDMMDLNIGDHNAFSKFSLGWVNPYKVTNDIDINLKPFQETGECVVIPVYPIMNSAFNEYLILEYYTPTGLNELDSKKSYLNRYPNVYTRPGVKIWHIDARLADRYNKDTSDVCDKLLTFDEVTNDKIRNVALSNTASRNPYTYQRNGQYNLIEAVTPDNIRPYNNAYLGYFRGQQNIRGLFIPGDTFNYKASSSFFTEGSALHDKDFPFNWSIRIEQMDKAAAKISIHKVA